MKCHCHRCHYDWESRAKEEPKACPRCKSYQWREPSKYEEGEK